MEEKGFQVVVEDKERLFEQFSDNNDSFISKMSHQLGGAPLEEPAEKVEVIASSNGNHYMLSATVYMIQRPEGIFKKKELTLPHKQLSQHFSTKKVGQCVFIFDDKGREEFIVYLKGGLIEEFKIEAGGGEESQSLSSPLKRVTTLEDFKKDVLKFTKLVEVTVSSIYEDLHKKSPSVTLYLRPSILKAKVKETQVESSPTEDDVRKDMVKKTIEIDRPNVTFDDIGGQESAEKEVRSLSLWLKDPERYKKWGNPKPKGVLIHGPEGTGKNLLAMALANEAEANFYRVRLSDMTSMWRGQEEKRFQDAIDIAEENGPSILFLNELDALAGQRSLSHEVTQRVVATLNENFGDTETSCKNVMLLACTNRLEAVDNAVIRAGRFDRLVEVFLPDDEERAKIFTIHLAKAEKIAERELFVDIDWNPVVNQTHGINGADIAEIIRRVLEEKVWKEDKGETVGLATTEDILEQIKTYERVK
ncbi:ATP-binding protein [Patescibacteria group bacterium AH-259-L07]|nr:ATP-binding protein [Patescibacteria group bacterium AH-259-L07]